jgi:hypothetical protein
MNNHRRLFNLIPISLLAACIAAACAQTPAQQAGPKNWSIESVRSFPNKGCIEFEGNRMTLTIKSPNYNGPHR